MKLHGKRILVNKPEVNESAFELSEKDKALLEADMRTKWTALDVFAVGSEVELFKEGDPTEGEEGKDWVWIVDGSIWTSIDDNGREWPCAEYDYDPDGYEREINPHEYEKNSI